MYPVRASEAASDKRLAEEQTSFNYATETFLPEDHVLQENHSLPEDHLLAEEILSQEDPLSPEEHLLPIGRNCRINIADKHEIVRLNEELQDLQRWFEEYGQDGILFPNSIINSFAPRAYSQAA